MWGYHTLPISRFINFNNKTGCTYFNPLIPGGKQKVKLKQIYSQKLLFNMYDLLLPPGMTMLKGGTVK